MFSLQTPACESHTRNCCRTRALPCRGPSTLTSIRQRKNARLSLKLSVPFRGAKGKDRREWRGHIVSQQQYCRRNVNVRCAASVASCVFILHPRPGVGVSGTVSMPPSAARKIERRCTDCGTVNGFVIQKGWSILRCSIPLCTISALLATSAASGPCWNIPVTRY